MAFELVSEFLKRKDYQAGRHHLQTMLNSIDKVKDSYALREEEDEEVTKELKASMEDYLISCDIAQALEGLESGQLLYSLAKKDLESNDVEYALNKGWDALDKLKEVEILSLVWVLRMMTVMLWLPIPITRSASIVQLEEMLGT